MAIQVYMYIYVCNALSKLFRKDYLKIFYCTFGGRYFLLQWSVFAGTFPTANSNMESFCSRVSCLSRLGSLTLVK